MIVEIQIPITMIVIHDAQSENTTFDLKSRQPESLLRLSQCTISSGIKIKKTSSPATQIIDALRNI